MAAMKPLFDVIFGLEGFEKTAFWLGMFIAFLGAGFFVDYLMHKQGFGVFWNGVYVFIAAICRPLFQIQLFPEATLHQVRTVRDRRTVFLVDRCFLDHDELLAQSLLVIRAVCAEEANGGALFPQ